LEQRNEIADLVFWKAALLGPHHSWMHWEHHTFLTVPYHRLGEVRKHTPGRPVRTLGELLRWFETTRPVPSGQALRVTATGGDGH